MTASFPIERETAAYLAAFAAQPPRENQTIGDLRAGYKAELIRCAPPADSNVAKRNVVIPGPAGDIAGRLYAPREARARGPVLLYIHGGGFAVGDLDSHDGLVTLIASVSSLRVLAINYRRAPENPFPAARDDALAAFHWVASNGPMLDIDPSRIVLGGESAGAAHAVAAALALRASPTPPRAVWVMSPALDATVSGETYAMFATGTGRTAAEFAYLWSLYAPDAAMRADPAVSPGLDDPAGLPPLYLYTAEFDPARSDGEAFADKAQRAGVEVVLRRRAGLIHQYPEIAGVSAASRAAVVAAAEELASDLG
jgi:acetyl esterase